MGYADFPCERPSSGNEGAVTRNTNFYESLQRFLRKHASTILTLAFYSAGLVGSLVSPELRSQYVIIALFCLLTIITYIELRTGLILTKLTYPGMGLGLVLNATISLETFVSALIGLIIGGGIFLSLSLLSKGGIGGGIPKLTAMIGAFVGWRIVLATSLLAVITVGIYAFAMLAMRSKTRKDLIEFGPFLSFFTVLVTLLNSAGIIPWELYFNWI